MIESTLKAVCQSRGFCSLNLSKYNTVITGDDLALKWFHTPTLNVSIFSAQLSHVPNPSMKLFLFSSSLICTCECETLLKFSFDRRHEKSVVTFLDENLLN